MGENIPHLDLIIQLVSDYVPNEDLLRFRRVSRVAQSAVDDVPYIGSKRFRAVMNSVEQVWTLNNSNQFHIPKLELKMEKEQMIANYQELANIPYLSKIKTLGINFFTGCTEPNEYLFMEAFHEMDQLEIEYLEMTNDIIPFIPQTFIKLKRLEITFATGNQTNQYIQKIVTLCLNLREVSFPMRLEYINPEAELKQHILHFQFLTDLITNRLAVGNKSLKILGIQHLDLNFNTSRIHLFLDFVKMCFNNGIKLNNVPSSLLAGYDTVNVNIYPLEIINASVLSMDHSGFCNNCFLFTWDNLTFLSIGRRALSNMLWPQTYAPQMLNLEQLEVNLQEAIGLIDGQINWDHFNNILFPMFEQRKRTKLIRLEAYGDIKINIGDDFFARLVNNAPNLKHLIMREWILNDIHLIYTNLTKLEELRIIETEELMDWHLVGEDDENPLIFNLKNLNRLEIDMNESTQITTNFLEQILSQMTLSTLRLYSYSRINRTTIDKMLQGRLGASLRHNDFPSN